MAKRKNFGTPADADMKINSDIIINGSIEGKGNLWIDGIVYGDVKISGNLFVAENAKIHGNATANNINILGFIKGVIKAYKTLSLGSIAKLSSDIYVKHLITEDGSIFKGKCHLIDSSSKAEVNSDKSNNIKKQTITKESNLLKNKIDSEKIDTQAAIETEKLNKLMKKTKNKNKVNDFYEIDSSEKTKSKKKTGIFSIFKKKDTSNKIKNKKEKTKKAVNKNIISDDPANDPVLAQIFSKKKNELKKREDKE